MKGHFTIASNLFYKATKRSKPKKGFALYCLVLKVIVFGTRKWLTTSYKVLCTCRAVVSLISPVGFWFFCCCCCGGCLSPQGGNALYYNVVKITFVQLKACLMWLNYMPKSISYNIYKKELYQLKTWFFLLRKNLDSNDELCFFEERLSWLADYKTKKAHLKIHFIVNSFK